MNKVSHDDKQQISLESYLVRIIRVIDEMLMRRMMDNYLSK